MESSSEDASRPVRRVRCPRCHSVLEEPGAPVYQCGGCGTHLRAKNRTGSAGAGAGAGAVPGGSTSTSGTGPGLPPRTTHLDAADVASTSRSSTPTPPPDVRTSWRQATDAATSSRQQHDAASTSSAPGAAAGASRRQGSDATSRRQSGDLVSVRGHGSGDDGASTSTRSTPDAANTGRRRQGAGATSRRGSGDIVSATSRVSDPVALIEKRVVRHESSSAASQEARRQDYSEGRRAGGAGGAGSPAGVSAVHFSGASKQDVSESLQDDSAEKTTKRQALESTDEARKKHPGEAALRSAQAAAAQSARDVLRREEDAAAAAGAGDKAPSPSRHDVQAEENLGPLRNKILQTVDELKGDLSELFSKSPELNAPLRARPPRRPMQEEGYVSSARAARAHHAAAAAGGHRASAPRVAKPAPPRGLPSRRYRQCRADPCCHSVQQRPCHHGCCRHHGKPECGSCRGHCCRPRAEEPSAPRKPAPKEAPKRRLAPRNHCRPVLKGAPFIVCSSCFKLVQVPADFAVATKTVRKLRCGSCSTVLSYSYRDPARKKAAYQDSSSIDRCSTDDGPDSDLLLGGGRGFPPLHPFAPFVDGFGLSSYSTDDEQPLHVSRNTSFDTIDGAKGVGRLHRLMGYASASELLHHSPDLYESFSERTTPDVMGMGHHDRKGKSVCVVDDDDGYDVDDSDDEDGGALKRSAARGPGWPLPWMPGKGTPPPGAIRIK